jgi:hypothetical protein
MIQELDIVVLARDFDVHGLEQGDIGTVVHKYSEEAFEVEFATAEGRTVAVLTLKEGDIRALQSREILHVREISQAANASTG